MRSFLTKLVARPTKEDARKLVKGLVERYLKDKEKWRTRNESETRAQFLDPLLKALGWDFDVPEEVRMEVKVLDEESRMKLDYVFLINNVEKLIVEAKATREDISKIQYQRQAIEYAYNLSCSWSVLTNFEGLKIFYVAEEGVVFRDIQLTNIERFDENFENLWLISYESFLIGNIERKAEDEGRKRRSISIDNDLLESLNDWRERIYRDIKFRYGKEYSDELIEEIVQKIIDRLIFIRKIEDMQGKRILEQVVRQESPEMYKELKKIFAKFNDEYNSKLFGETKDDIHQADLIDLSNSTLTQVIAGMYKPKGRTVTYNFAIIDADILGQIYEQYLGHILKRQKIVDGKSHRKEQGIYYTPKYIVDFIIRNTLGVLLQERGIDARKIRVLDPACGSGSFLIKAYDYLLRYRRLKEGVDSQTMLDFEKGVTFTRKTQIVTENIFGVDLDVKAVEIAQLNLLLKIAELKERLPTLRSNIQVGNSLIDDDKVSVRAFKWDERFGNIMLKGGFDVIIGNPPYGARIIELDKLFLKEHYKSATGRYDSYFYFIEKSINLLKEGGLLGFIVPDTWLTNHQTENLRRMVLENCVLTSIVSLPQKVFHDANVDTCIIILRRESNRDARSKNKIGITILGKDAPLESLLDNNSGTQFSVIQKDWISDKRALFNIHQSSSSLVKRISIDCIRLGEISEMTRGINPYAKSELIEKHGKERGTEIVEKRIWHSDKRKGPDYKKELVGSDIGRYSLDWKSGQWVKYGPWLSRPRDSKFFTLPHLVVQRIRNPKLLMRIVATFIDPKEEYYNNSGLTNIIVTDTNYSMKYILAILNSKLINWYYRQFFRDVNIKPEDLRELPIKKAPSVEQEALVVLVDKILLLNSKLLEIGEKRSDQRREIEDEIRKTNNAIDESIYDLYGITESERKIIETELTISKAA